MSRPVCWTVIKYFYNGDGTRSREVSLLMVARSSNEGINRVWRTKRLSTEDNYSLENCYLSNGKAYISSVSKKQVFLARCSFNR